MSHRQPSMRTRHRPLVKLVLGLALAAFLAEPVTAQNLSEYRVQIERIELCRDATCTDTILLGAGADSFDIAGSAPPGGAVGSFGDVVRPTVGDTFSHMAVTVSRTIQANGIANNNPTCATQAGSNGAIGAAAAGGAAATRGSARLVIPSAAVIGVDLENSPGTLTFAQSLAWVGGNQNTAASARLIYALSAPFTAQAEPPAIDVTFNTNGALQDIGGCTLIPLDPDVRVTIQ
ncbi:MAG: hypothetical protein NXI21_02235 [Alphaproteobacteria bacterium]|nr:hypothetical protein [Alphaproteobacteria bacterium]